MKKIFIIVIALVMCSLVSQSQIRFGVKAGLNLANMVQKNDLIDFGKDASMKLGFHLGATAEFSLTKEIAIEPGLLFSMKGFSYDNSGMKFKTNINYLEIPINCMYKIDMRPAKVMIFAGPYIGYAFSGKNTSDDPMFGPLGDQKEEDINIGSDKEKDEIKALDFGINIGVGGEMNNMTLSLQYGLGLANFATVTDNGTTYKNKVIGISLGYKFGDK
jgi:hypothetical protein